VGQRSRGIPPASFQVDVMTTHRVSLRDGASRSLELIPARRRSRNAS
jgi:hypothetical protein